jgi:hypothetical protein
VLTQKKMSTGKPEDELTRFIKKTNNHEIKMLELLFIEFTRVKESKGRSMIPSTLYTIIGTLKADSDWSFNIPIVGILYSRFKILKWIRLASYKYKEYLSAKGKNNENPDLHTFSEIYKRHKAAKPPREVTNRYPKPNPPSTGRYSKTGGNKTPAAQSKPQRGTFRPPVRGGRSAGG